MRPDIKEAVYMAKKERITINYAEVARQYGCDYRTVKKYYETQKDEPVLRKARVVSKKTDGFEEIIKKKYLEYHATAKSIYSFLKDNKKYTGSYSTIKKFTHDLKEDMIQKATLRFETNPGLQCQIDWKEELTLKNRNGEAFTVNIFLNVLGYSRLKYIELTTERTQPTLFRCLRNAFEYFKGVPHELLFDNMRTVVDQSRTQFQTVVFNEKLHEFAKDAGFEPFACVAYRPRTKGKVEAVAHLKKRLNVYNDEFDTLEDLYKLVKQLNKEINEEVNGTTKEKPNERFKKEKEYLAPEPNYDILDSYFLQIPLSRKVSNDSLVIIDSTKYSVPPKYIGKKVTCEICNNKIHLFYGKQIIATHEVSTKPINYLEEHYSELAKYVVSTDEIEDFCKKNLELLNQLA